jgi:phage head maturation protease
MERKTFQTINTKVDTDQGIVEHIVAVMGNVDFGGDVIHPGAFVKSISERGGKVKVLDHHNTDSIMRVIGKPIGLRELGRSELPPDLLMRYPEATGALMATTQYLMNTPEGKGSFERIKTGTVDEYSIGYDALDVDYSKAIVDGKAATVRNLRTIKLYEYSPVLWGMNPATSTLSAKADKPSEGKPYGVFMNGEQHCVYKIDADGERTGESLGCHGTEDEAMAQMRAIMANEKAADTGDLNSAELEQAVAEPEAEKTGRRVRRDKVELLRQLSEITRELMTWADYDDAVEEAEEQPDEKQQAGPGATEQPPTSQDQERLIEIELAELDLFVR